MVKPKNSVDIVATIELFATESGGRKGPTPESHFSCIMMIDEMAFDVRLFYDDKLIPGQTKIVSIGFLNREAAWQHCAVGRPFILREVTPIGRGTMDELVAKRDVQRSLQ